MKQFRMQAPQKQSLKVKISLFCALLSPVLVPIIYSEFPLTTTSSYGFVWVFGGMVFASYFFMLHTISNHLEEYDSRNVAGPLFIFLMTTALLILEFGLGWNNFHGFSTSNGALATEKFDAIYFSGITFFTIGYGDFVPKSDSGKLLALIEAFLGATHMLAFLAALLKRGK